MWTVEDLALIGKAFPPHIVNILGRLEQRMRQSGETREQIIEEIRAGYERSLLDEEHTPAPPRDELQEQIDLIRWVIGDLTPPIAKTAPPLLTEPDARVVPDELGAILGPGESLAQAVDRIALDADALLDMNDALSPDAMEAAISSMTLEKRADWVAKLHGMKADLRLKRGTDQEDIPKEDRITGLTNTFARVGAGR